jgi:hypothetical protein
MDGFRWERGELGGEAVSTEKELPQISQILFESVKSV